MAHTSDTTPKRERKPPTPRPAVAEVRERLADPHTAWVPVDHAAVLLSMSRAAGYRAARAGFLVDGIEVVRIGTRKWGVPAAQLRRFLGWPADGWPADGRP